VEGPLSPDESFDEMRQSAARTNGGSELRALLAGDVTGSSGGAKSMPSRDGLSAAAIVANQAVGR